MDVGVPPGQVARLERMLSTFVLGYAASEVSGRFAQATLGTRERRASCLPVPLGGYHRVVVPGPGLAHDGEPVHGLQLTS